MAFHLAVAVLLCSAQHLVWGMLFYGVLPTSQLFLRLAHPNRSKKDIQATPPPTGGYVASMLGGVGSTLALRAVLALPASPPGAAAAAALGAIVAASGLMDMLPHSFFEGRPFALTLLHGAYHVVGGAMKGAILSAAL